MAILDLSLTIDNDCQTCGTPWHEKVCIKRKGMLETVGRNTSSILLGSHSATHMDAPLHFINDGHGIDRLDLDICVGPVTCVDFRCFGREDVVALEDIKKVKITTRMLFVFGWYTRWKTPDYYDAFPYFSFDAIEYMLKHGMRLMALDTPSPDDGSAISEFDDSPNHKRLLGSNVIIVEYLSNTDKIDFTKNYEIVALPLKIAEADGSPARVVLRSID